MNCVKLVNFTIEPFKFIKLMAINILAIESSCDDTSAAVLTNTVLMSNIIASQEVHRLYGGVVPELASRAHQQNIVPTVNSAIEISGIKLNELSAIAFTRGPGLLGSLLVGTSFAKGLALALDIPLIEVNHLKAHVLSHFIDEEGQENRHPEFPYLCMLVSGGHTQIVKVDDHEEMVVLGQTIDDAAGEAFDKCGKVMGLNYPAGPVIDRNAKFGDPQKFTFAKPRIDNLDFSFSGLKTSFLYTIRDKLKENPLFIEENMNDLCASLQSSIVEILVSKMRLASKQTGISQIALGGGVSANSSLRLAFQNEAKLLSWNLFLPSLKFTTDNAAMIGIAGYYKYLKGEFSNHSVEPIARIGL